MKRIFLLYLFIAYMFSTFNISYYVFAEENTIKEELFVRNGKEVYLSYPKNLSTSPKVVMAIHGSGREARSYKLSDQKGVPFYAHQRDLAVNNGYIFVVVSNGGNTWGTQNGLNSLLDVYSYVQQRFNSNSEWILWSTSAGGTLANLMVQNHPKKVQKVIGTFPVYDLVDSFDRLKSAPKVWKTRENAEKNNPSDKPELLTSKPYLIYHGLEDKAVPHEQHSSRLANEVNKLGGNVKLHLVSGGHSTDNWNVYNDNEIIAFMKSKNPISPVKITNITANNLNRLTVKTPISISTKAIGGTKLYYEYWISQPNQSRLRVIRKYSIEKTFKWIPRYSGKYLISVHVKDKSSKKAYDVYKHFIINIK